MLLLSTIDPESLAVTAVSAAFYLSSVKLIGDFIQSIKMSNLTAWEITRRWWCQDADIAQFTSDAEFTPLSSIEMKQVQSWAVIMEYQGLDLKKLIKNMYRSWTAYKIQPREAIIEEYIHEGKPVTYEYSNQESFYRDVTSTILIFANRGSSWAKIMQKSSDNGKRVMNWMREKFIIDTNIRPAGRPIGPEVVTLPRIASCFPQYVCEVYEKGSGKPLYSLTDIGLPEEIEFNSFLTTFYTSMISSCAANKNKEVHLLMFYCHVLVDNIIHDSVEKRTPLDRMISYYEAALKSVATPQPARDKWNIHRLFISRDSTYNSVIINAGSAAEEKILSARPQDPARYPTIEKLKKLTF